MMNPVNTYHLKPSGDPRTLADYVSLRDEMSKLTHPARPDVNWPHAETLCLSLFEHNGVELQTAAWYTLALTHLSGLYGMNEGLAILDALLTSVGEHVASADACPDKLSVPSVSGYSR
jgi:type VI secretion system protein VasL